MKIKHTLEPRTQTKIIFLPNMEMIDYTVWTCIGILKNLTATNKYHYTDLSILHIVPTTSICLSVCLSCSCLKSNVILLQGTPVTRGSHHDARCEVCCPERDL